MKTLIEYLGSRLEPVDCAYIVEDIEQVELKSKNIQLMLAKAGMRTIPISPTAAESHFIRQAWL